MGWARSDCPPGQMLGQDEYTWAFDGYNVSKFIIKLYGLKIIIRIYKYIQQKLFIIFYMF